MCIPPGTSIQFLCHPYVYGTILPKYYTAVTIWCIFKYALGSVNDKCTISLWHCSQQDSPRGGKWSGVEMTEEEALVEQQRMFAEARARMNGANIPKQSDSDRSMDRWQIFQLCPFLNESLGVLGLFFVGTAHLFCKILGIHCELVLWLCSCKMALGFNLNIMF